MAKPTLQDYRDAGVLDHKPVRLAGLSALRQDSSSARPRLKKTHTGQHLQGCVSCYTYVDRKATPILAGLIAAGSVVVRDDEYVGKASDGVEVFIGSTRYPVLAENYLAEHPTPESW